MKYYLILIFSIIAFIYSTIPNWDIDSTSVNLFSSSSSANSYDYTLYNNNNFVLKKTITKDNGKIKDTNYLTYTTDGTTKKVDFERIESVYWNQLGTSIVICPKGSFHPYNFYGGTYIKPFDSDGNWELSCYYHKTTYFLVFYAHNGGYNLYYVKGNTNSFKKYTGFDELYSYKLPEYEDKGQNYEYKFPSLRKAGKNLIISGFCLIMNSNSNENAVNGNQIHGSTTIITAKSETRGTIDSSYYFYYFTYNNITDFSSGFSNTCLDLSRSSYANSFSITNNRDSSPLSFVDNVEIKEMNFIPGTQYIYYKLYNNDKDTTYCGLIDVKTNRVLYNIEADIILFTPDYNNHMLAMTSTTLYRICVYKDGDSCSDTECSNLMLDPDGNKCQSSCDNGKIKLMPEGICINKNLCDLNIYILSSDKTECGLCKYFYPSEAKYKLMNTTGCLSEIPINAEFYNEAQKLLKCKTNYHLEESQCIPDTCYERCEKCSEVSTDVNDQKCLTCISGYVLDDDTKNCNTPAPTTQIIIPTTHELSLTTQMIIPSTQLITPTTQLIVPTTQEITPTIQDVPTTQEIIHTTQEITPTTQIIIEAPVTTPETEKIEECVNKKCLKCSVESNKLELCLSCDITKYKVVNFTDIYPQYINCLEPKKVQTKYYYDNEVDQYRPCYSTCKTCSGHGNLTVQNCIECDSNYMLRPGYNPYNNCVVYSKYYYLSPYNEYKPLNNPQCPEEAKYKVIDDNNKTSCIFDCKAHSTNNLLYQGLCWKECPDGTTPNNFICIENDPDKIYISKDEIYMDTNDTIKVIEILAITYSKEFNYTDNHISYYNGENLTVGLYKKPDIISNSGLKMPDIDFGDCYEKVKNAYYLGFYTI